MLVTRIGALIDALAYLALALAYSVAALDAHTAGHRRLKTCYFCNAALHAMLGVVHMLVL